MCIPHNDGLEAALEALAEHEDHDPMRPPIQILREVMSIVLKTIYSSSTANTTFKCKAMGTKMAPAFSSSGQGLIKT